MGNILLKTATVITFDPLEVERADLRISNGKILQRGPSLDAQPGEEAIDIAGKLVMPGMVCAHTHLYSALARGMPGPVDPPRNFLEILQKIWWKLDRALDEEAIYYSAIVGAIDAARAGTTCVIDHHASPNCITGSLSIIRQALEKVGIRAALCYEVTDRGGERERNLGLDENRAFLAASNGEMFRGLVGAHASFTLSSESLRGCAELARQFTTGIHIHVAEAPDDEQDAREKYHCSLIERLAEAGALNERAILAHCTHLSEESLSAARQAACWLAHNPRSNMNNQVGYANVASFGDRATLGADGISGDMFEEAHFAFFKARDARSAIGADDVLHLLSNNHKLASTIFGSNLDDLKQGSAADLIVLDYASPTPLTPANFAWHLVFGLTAASVESVMVNGKFIIRGRAFETLDVGEIYRKARLAAQRLWAKM